MGIRMVSKRLIIWRVIFLISSSSRQCQSRAQSLPGLVSSCAGLKIATVHASLLLTNNKRPEILKIRETKALAR